MNKIHLKSIYLSIFSIFYLLLLPSYAGGDYVKGKVTKVIKDSQTYSIGFTQTDRKRSELIEQCLNMTVIIKYQTIPWYSQILWRGNSIYPKKKETLKGIKYLEQAQRLNQEIYLGYLGDGLQPTNQKCVFQTRGIHVTNNDDQKLILFINNPI